jgi:hypothetical protein
VIGDSLLDSAPVIFRYEKQAVIIKNGKSDGRTQANQRFSPSLTELDKVGESASRPDSAIKSIKRKDSKKEFNVLVILYCIMT